MVISRIHRTKFWLQIVLIITVFYSGLALGKTIEHLKNWDTIIITGPLSSDKKIKYYLQPQLDLIDDKYKYQTGFLFAGVGYQYAPKVTFWLMDGYFDVKNTNGHVQHWNVVRQQLDWSMIDVDSLKLTFISRLEERKNFAESRWAFRAREMLTLRLPFKYWENHSLVLSDEAFFNFNHPSWINNNTFLQQNRAFIGIGTELSKQISFDVGYLNQYVMNKTDSQNNVIYLIFNVTTG